MSNKLTTTSSLLFTNNNTSQMPEWIEGLNVDVKETTPLDLSFDNKGAFAERTTVNREMIDSTPRELEASYNDNRMATVAKINLAKFLTGKYYKAEATTHGDHVYLGVTIDGINSKFTFGYQVESGRVNQHKTFFAMVNDEKTEYPFNKLGFEECLMDIKNQAPKTSKKVEAVGKTYFITKQEIIRRYNEHLREATDKINELVASGELIGVGSNTFATIYDVDQLFPQMEKEASDKQIPAFDFAPNVEHVEAKPHLATKMLNVEASKILSQLFSDHVIEMCDRDNNEFLVKATVLTGNGTHATCDFCFGIKGMGIDSLKLVECNDKRMTPEQFLQQTGGSNTNVLNAYLNNDKVTTTKKIYRGVVLTAQEISRKLHGIINKDNVPYIVANWVERGLVNPVNSTTFTTTRTFEDLLASVNVQTLSEQEKAILAKYQQGFGEGLDMNRIEQKDTGVRENEDIVASDEIRLSNLKQYLTNHFDQSAIQDYVFSGNDCEAKIAFINPTTSVRTGAYIKANFVINKVNDVKLAFEGKLVDLDLVKELTSTNSLLKTYLNNKQGKLVSKAIVLSEKSIVSKLNQFFNSENTIKSIVASWINTNKLKSIGNNAFVSNFTFEQLLNTVDENLFSNDTYNAILAAKNYYGEGLQVNRNDVQDTGVRDQDDVEENDITKQANLKNHLTKHFKQFQLGEMKKVTATVKDGIHLNSYEAELGFRNETTGVVNKVTLASTFFRNNLYDAQLKIGGKLVGIKEAQKLFSGSKVLTAYLQDKKSTFAFCPIVITAKSIKSKLENFVGNDKVDEIVANWHEKGLIKNIGTGLYSSALSFEELLNMVGDTALLSAEDSRQVQMAKQHFGEAEMFSREDVTDTGVREVDDYVTDETIFQAANKYLAQHFNNFEVVSFSMEGEGRFMLYTIKLFDEETGLNVMLDLTFTMDGNDVCDCCANVNGEKLKLSNIRKAFAMNETLSKYLQYNKGKHFNAPIVMSKKQFKSKLASIANVTDEEVDDTIHNWMKLGKIKMLNTNLFASKHTFEQLISMSNIQSLSDEQIKAKLARSQRSRMLEVKTGSYIQDSDTRAMVETWSPERMLVHAKTELGKLFRDYDILDADLDNNSYTITARVVNPFNGLRQKLSFKFAMVNDKPSKLTTISSNKKSVAVAKLNELEDVNESLREFIVANGAVNKQYKNIFSKSNLRTKLGSVIDSNTLEQVVKVLVENEILNPINSYTFASSYSLNEIVNHLASLNQTNVQVAKEQHRLARRNEEEVDTDTKAFYDTDARVLEHQAEVITPKILDAKEKINGLLKKALDNKKITKNRFNQISEMVTVAKSSKEVDSAWRELQKYLYY